MPLSLPNLDDLSWEDLLEEGRALIPAWAPEWTNHNPADPGITLMELFAYFSEKLMYRLNRISDENVREYLKLINGPDWDAQGALADKKRETLNSLRESRRAVAPEDFEKLAVSVPNVVRSKCIARRNLESIEPDAKTADAPGHVSVVVLPNKRLRPSRELLASVKQKLEPARMLTTRVHAVGPRYLSLRCRFTVVPQRGTHAEFLRKAAIKRLEGFFDPIEGGTDEKGWPFGGNIYLSELYRILSELPGIENVTPAKDSHGARLDELMVEPGDTARLRRNSRGEVEAVILQPDELVEAKVDSADITLPPHV